jgi:hypothetical protein
LRRARVAVLHITRQALYGLRAGGFRATSDADGGERCAVDGCGLRR